jgi:hypothetical protein
MLSCINPFYPSWVLSCVLCVFIIMFILSSLGAILLVMNFGGGYTPFMFRAIDLMVLCYVVPLMFFELCWSSSLGVSVLFVVCFPNNVDFFSSLHVWSLSSSYAFLTTSILFLVCWFFSPKSSHPNHVY